MRSAPLSMLNRGVLLAGSLVLVAACSSAGSSAGGYGVPLSASAPPAGAAGGAVAGASASPSGGYYGGSADNGGSNGGGRYGGGSPAAPTTGAAEIVVNAVAMSGLGDVLTAAGGRTLYVFKKDGPDQSACAGACAGTWPAFTVQSGQSVKAGTGLNGTLGTFARSDGTVQVTLDKAPLYYFSGDAKAGDAHGQGIGGVWFVAASGGAKAPAPGASATSGYGY